MNPRAVWWLLRPKQWTKNLLALAAWVFTGSYTDLAKSGQAWLALAALCLVSSASYALNDVLDAESDRLHPTKRSRPVASGALAPSVAIGVGLVCAVLGLAVARWIGPSVLWAIVAFAGIQGAYNLGLKRVPVLDVLLISLAFVQRAAVGAVAIQVHVSAWLLFCTGALALLLGFSKRRHEFALQQDTGVETRSSLSSLSLKTLDGFVLWSAALAAIGYGMYAIESETARTHPALILTSPIVLYGILRYLYLVFERGEGGEPESVLFGDPHLLATFAAFVLAALAAMSGLQLPFLGPASPQ